MGNKKYLAHERRIDEANPPPRTGEPGEFRRDRREQRRILIAMRALKEKTIRERSKRP